MNASPSLTEGHEHGQGSVTVRIEPVPRELLAIRQASRLFQMMRLAILHQVGIETSGLISILVSGVDSIGLLGRRRRGTLLAETWLPFPSIEIGWCKIHIAL